MPRKPMNPCRHPGCPALTTGQYCEKHRKKANHDYNTFFRDPAHKERYHNAEWHRVRAAQLERQPLCEMCMADGKYVKATLVHHRVPLAEGGTNAAENLCSLCASHHTTVHNRMRQRLTPHDAEKQGGSNDPSWKIRSENLGKGI